MDCRLEWALRALYTAPRSTRRSRQRPLPGRRQVPQRFDERPVGFEQILTSKTRGRHPLERWGFERARRAAISLDDPERQLDVAIAVGVLEAHEGPRRGDFDPELLAQLARKSRELGLTVGGLAAREFPAPGEVLARRSLRDEDAPALIVERRRHHQHRRAAHQLRGARIRAPLAEVRELAVTVLVLLARAARARLVASHFPLVAHEGRGMWCGRG